MSFVTKLAKKIVFWTYPRTSWQWDVLCVLILVFIFLTPKTWFENNRAPQTAVIWTADLTVNPPDNNELERRAKLNLNRSAGHLSAVRKRVDDSGKVIAYEVDIR